VPVAHVCDGPNRPRGPKDPLGRRGSGEVPHGTHRVVDDAGEGNRFKNRLGC
jgi:hypothetical protein